LRVIILRFLNEMLVILGNEALRETLASIVNIGCVVHASIAREDQRVRASACPTEVAVDVAVVYGSTVSVNSHSHVRRNRSVYYLLNEPDP
jgi:hypothetical protein